MDPNGDTPIGSWRFEASFVHVVLLYFHFEQVRSNLVLHMWLKTSSTVDEWGEIVILAAQDGPSGSSDVGFSWIAMPRPRI
jgi:hypothetical protein